MSDSTVRFGLLVSMFQAMARDRSAAKKRKRFRTFLDRVYTSRDYFSAVRLVLPELDRERGTYGLKESGLAAALVDALGISKDSEDAKKLINWRRGGAKSGANAGNFALVAAEVLQSRQGLASGGLTIKEVNDALDQLAAKEGRGEKAAVLSDLIKKTNALEMKWILMIILKDLKLGVSEKSIFHEFHPDAEDLFNVTCDLKLVCEKLKDRSERHKRQDIEVGKPVRPQLAMRVSDASAAWKKLHGKQVVVECKFDGDRIQIHKNGTDIHFFSRNFLDHSEYVPGMSDVILKNILVDRCILDGEMLVWDTSRGRFAEFGSNQEIAKAAKEGLESDRQLCYVAFDILYAGDTSVIHQSLRERHDLLRKVVEPLKGRLEILLPNGGLNDHRPPGEPCWSIIAYSQEDVERFFKETIENRDEGIVLKDLDSKWEPSDRSGKWLKLKPDYVHAGADLDVLIIGGYFGSGRRGGEVAQFLVGLAERSESNAYPKRFFSFCRVGTGLSDEELDAVVTKLKPYFRKNENPKKVPRLYEVTNSSKERPDVWIDCPDKSIILSITSDIRTIRSEVFAAPYGLRFPRIQRVRYDKPWYECLDLESFVELVQSSNGNMRKGPDQEAQNRGSKRAKSGKKNELRSASIIPAHLIQTDITGVKEQSSIFANMMFYFINTPPLHTVDYFHKIVVEHGGAFSMNLNDSVTHCIAAEEKGIRYNAAKRHGDIIHYSWVLDCCTQKRLVHLQPKYFLFLANSSKKKFKDEIDEFSDYYYWDLDITDLKQIFDRMSGYDDFQTIEYYKKKYCPMESLCLFKDCCIYLYGAECVPDGDWKVVTEIALRRMGLEISMRGGEVCKNLSLATHLVAYSPTSTPKFEEIYNSFPAAQKRLFHYKKLNVVKHQWLEESVEEGKKLPEDAYNLKPDDLEEFKDEKRHDIDVSIKTTEKKEQPEYRETDVKRKRGRSVPGSTSSRGRRASVKPARGTRAQIGNRTAKIESNESESKESENNHSGESSEQSTKRGRPARTSTSTGRAAATAAKPSRRARVRIGNRTARIESNESESNESENNDSGESSEQLRKRGRPAHTKTSTGRAAATAAKRSRKTRERIGNRTARIESNESESYQSENNHSGKSSEQPRKKGRPACTNTIRGRDAAKAAKPSRRTRAQVGNRSAEIETNKSESEESSGEYSKKAPPKASDESHGHMEIDDAVRSHGERESDGFSKTDGGKTKLSSDDRNEGDDGMQVTQRKRNENTERMEQTVDPLQAMLFDMIPRLSQKVDKGEAGTSSRATDEAAKKQQEDAEAKPVKKKVSYKDVAGELLKDL